jgi:superfamily II DNA/RNA helicase
MRPPVDAISFLQDPAARRISVAKFRAKKSQFLVVTDIAARGIDIPMLDNVINYDFPMTSKLFVHRVGRAARAGRKGTAISFVSGDEMPYMLDVHLFLGRKWRGCSSPSRPVPRSNLGIPNRSPRTNLRSSG